MTDDIRHTLCRKSGKLLVGRMVFQSFAHPNSPDNPSHPKDPVKGRKGCLCLEQCADVRTPWRGAGRRRAVAGNGGAVAGNGGAVAGNGRAVAGRADSAHQHRLIQQEAVAIFGLVVLWCSGAFLFLQRCCCDSAPGRGGVCFRVVWCGR